MSPFKNDFIDGTYSVQIDNVGGIATGLKAAGVGKVAWTLTDTNGIEVTLPLDCLYVPDLPCRLLPPQQLGNTKHKPNQLPTSAQVGGGNCSKLCYDSYVFEFPYDKDTNLPTTKMIMECDKYYCFIATATSKDNTNLIASSEQFY